jgi:hypothetical protein
MATRRSESPMYRQSRLLWINSASPAVTSNGDGKTFVFVQTTRKYHNASSAAQASTGQQKALLIGVVLAHAALIAAARGQAPLLLLDEPAVHLDPGRRQALFSALAALPAQCFLTGTDAETFLPLRGIAEGLKTGGGTLAPDPGFPPIGLADRPGAAPVPRPQKALY